MGIRIVVVGRLIERFLLLLSGAGTPGRGMETYMRFPVYMIPMITGRKNRFARQTT